MGKVTLISIVVGLICAVIAVFALSEMVALKKDVSRLTENVIALKQVPAVSDSGRTIDVQQLQLTLSELKKALPTLKKELKEQGLKFNDLMSYQKATMEVNAKVLASATDTIISNQQYLQQHYADQWLQFTSLQKKGDSTAKVEAIIPISVSNVAYRYRHGFPFGLGWFKKYQIRQQMHTDNPYVLLKYQEVIDVKRD